MKHRFIFGTLFAAVALFSSCAKEQIISSIDGFDMPVSYVKFSQDGGSQTLSVTTDYSWSVDTTGTSKLFTISPVTGSGDARITVTAGANKGSDYTKEVKMYLTSGNEALGCKYITVSQASQSGGQAAPATVKDVMNGDDGQSFKVTATVMSIVNTHYGNIYLNDGTSDVDLYLYGVLDKKGNTMSSSTAYDVLDPSTSANAWDIQVGDVITVTGIRKTYSGTVEFENATIENVVKSLLDVTPLEAAVDKDGGVVEVVVKCKGNDLNVISGDEWIKLDGIKVGSDSTIVALNVAANEGDRRTGTVSITSSIPGQSSEKIVSITQASGFAAFPLPFESKFDKDMGSFTVNDINVPEGKTIWAWASAQYGMKATAGAKGVVSESDLVSPLIDLTKVSSAVLSFDHVQRYAGVADAEITLWASTDNGVTWTQVLIPNNPTGKDWNFISSGEISLKPFVGNLVKLAFKYKSTETAYATWEIKNLKVVEGEPAITRIAEINDSAVAAETAFTATLTDAVVSYVNGNNAFIEDVTGGIQLYLKDHGLKVGDKINGEVSGKVKLYSGYAELTSFDTSKAAVTEGEAPLTTLALDTLLKSYLRYQNRLVKLEGVTFTTALTTSNRNGVVTQGEREIAAYAQVKNTIEMNGSGDLVCIPIRYNANLQLGVWDNEHFTKK